VSDAQPNAVDLPKGSEVFVEGIDGKAAWCKVDKPLAQGGTAICYLAHWVESGAELVLKVPRPGSSSALADFERELEVTRAIRHENVAGLQGLGTVVDGRPFLAFARAHENPLLLLSSPQRRKRLMGRDPGRPYYPLPPNVALELTVELLRAIEGVHRAGYAHLDVKLANLMALPGRRAPRDAEREAAEDAALVSVAAGEYRGLLIDLGAARRLDTLDGPAQADAPPSQLTPFYAPPEALPLAPGATPRLSAGVDVYAAAFVLYAMITGDTPYSRQLAGASRPNLADLVDVKASEARGQLSPFDEQTLRDIPVGDMRLGVSPGDLASGVMGFLRACTAPAPQRPDAAAARALLERTFGFSPSPLPGRPWAHRVGALDPTSNRLLEAAGKSERQTGKVRASTAPPKSPSRPSEDGKDDQDGTARKMSELALDWDDIDAQTLVELVAASAKLSKDEFVARHAHPFLATELTLAAEVLERALAIPVKKRTNEQQERDRVHIGRTVGNDIVIPCESVSKRHASIIEARDGWAVVDRGSANGTILDGERLSMDRPRRLSRPISALELGPDVALHLLTPEAMWRFLQDALAVDPKPSPSSRRRATVRRRRATAKVAATGSSDPPTENTPRVVELELTRAVDALRTMATLLHKVEVDVAGGPLTVFQKGDDVGTTCARIVGLDGLTTVRATLNVGDGKPVVLYHRR
jgi:serine/threonine protein kinase